MTSVDLRTRPDRPEPPLDVSSFEEGPLASALDARGPDAAAAVDRLGLPPLTLKVEAETLSLAADQGALRAQRSATDAVVVAMDLPAFNDLVNDVSSFFGLEMTGRAEVELGSTDAMLEWEPVLRCLLDGRPVHQAGDIAFVDRDGEPLDLERSFTLDDDPVQLGHFLAQAGFLHVQQVFSDDEMAAVSEELDAAIARAEPDDGASWWATTTSGEHYPSRILGFNRHSPTLRALLHSDRFTSLGRLTDDDYVQRNPDEGDSAEGLLKKVGVVEGISDVSWHKDCAMGGHSRHCCGLTVGISVTGAGADNGELGAVAGSHRANVPMLGVEGLDLPRRALPTKTGDITIHCSCTLHMSRPPVSAERRVVYTGFGLVPRGDDEPEQLDERARRRARAGLNDRVTGQQRAGTQGSRRGTFDL